MSKERILQFIVAFEEMRDGFLNGKCYWFAKILETEFGGTLYYDDIMNHWATMIDGVLYDASGEISAKGFMLWSEMEAFDKAHYERLKEYCIDFTRS